MREYNLNRLRLWLARRFSREERFGLSLTVGLIVALLAGWIFGELADNLIEHNLATGIDMRFGATILDATTPLGSVLFYSITVLGSATFIIPAFLLISFYLWQTKRTRDILVYLAAVTGGLAINLILKNLFDRPRPVFSGLFYDEIGYSFPSGHAMMSVLFYGMSAFLLAQAVSPVRYRMALAAIALALIVLVSFSRLYLGVHYLTDIVGGWAAGTAWLATCVTAKKISGW